MAQAHRHDPRALVVAVIAIVIAIGLLANLGPDPVPDPPVAAVAPVQRSLEVIRPPAPAPAPAPSLAPAPVASTPPRHPHQAIEGAPAEPDTEPDRALLLIDVVDAEGRPTEGGVPVPVGCPGFEAGPRPGSYFADPGTCRLRAQRRDGMLRAMGRPTAVDAVAGEIAYVQLELASERTGGVGVRFRPHAEGMVVLQIVDGSAAWEAGLEPGDVIVGVEGIDTRGLPTDAFIDAMTGPEGTDVEFRVQFRGDTGTKQETIRVTRRFLDG
ncbi:MAG TPA: PDZ domain-containing protein [Deltaproteobacteria bacterium]|nr:PDZ domain-containing protein [Deltaproteobacteria bacterium]